MTVGLTLKAKSDVERPRRLARAAGRLACVSSSVCAWDVSWLITVTEAATLSTALVMESSVLLGKPSSETTAAVSIVGASREAPDDALRTRVTLNVAEVCRMRMFRARRRATSATTSHCGSSAQRPLSIADSIWLRLTLEGREVSTLKTCVMTTSTFDVLSEMAAATELASVVTSRLDAAETSTVITEVVE